MTDRPTGEVFVFRLRDGDGNIYTEYPLFRREKAAERVPEGRLRQR